MFEHKNNGQDEHNLPLSEIYSPEVVSYSTFSFFYSPILGGCNGCSDDNRTLAEIHDSIVERIQALNENKLTHKEAEEAAQSLLGFCYKIFEIAE